MNRLLLIVVLLFLASPIGAFAQDGPQLEARTSVTLMLDWTPNTNHTGFYVARLLGYYDDVNLELKIIEPTDIFPEQAVDNSLVDFGIGFQEFSTGAIVEGAKLVSIAAIIQHNTSGFVTIAEQNPISRPADLAPLTYGGFSLPNLENAILSQLLACDDASWNEDNYLDIGFADAIELMKRRRVDFAWIFYGWQGINAEVNGTELDAIMLMDYTDCVPDYYTPILLTSQEMIDEQPEVVQAFVHATARGYDFAIENPEEAADILLEAVPELDEELVRTSALWLADQYQAEAPRWGEQDAETWQGFTDFLIDNGIIEGPFDTSTVFTNEFLPESEE